MHWRVWEFGVETVVLHSSWLIQEECMREQTHIQTRSFAHLGFVMSSQGGE